MALDQVLRGSLECFLAIGASQAKEIAEVAVMFRVSSVVSQLATWYNQAPVRCIFVVQF